MNPAVHSDLSAALLALLIALNVWDARATVRALRAGAIERNPLIAAAVRRWGIVPGVVVPKAVVLGALAAALPAVPWWALAWACAWYAYWAARGFRA